MSDTCGCCSGIEERTPEPTANRPGLSQLAYRVGTHASFLETMLARLTTHALPDGRRPLQRLTTRAPDDPAIALLDAWAVVADVLSFYQERIANEGYLRTATERRSVLELARLVGYRLRPGVAASVYLAYEMEPGVDKDTEIPAGSRVQSVPRPGELPQSFETSGPIKARTRWNAISPRQTRPQLLTRERFELGGILYLKGISTNLKPNAPLLLTLPAGPELYRIMEVTTDPAADRTAVRLQPWRESPATNAQAARMREIGARYANLEAFNVAETETARELQPMLRRLADASGMSAIELLRFARDEVLPRLRKTQATAERLDWGRLRKWLTEAITAIEATLRTTATLGASAQPVAANDLGGLVRELERRPASPPSSPQRVKRDLARAFAPGSEAAASLLGALRPGLGPALYAGWASLPVPTTTPTVEGHALRAQTGVYGGTAPPKTNVPGNQVPDDQWQLGFSSGPEFEVSYSLQTIFTGSYTDYEPQPSEAAVVELRVANNSSGRLELALPTYNTGPIVRELRLGGENVRLELSYLFGDLSNNYVQFYRLRVSFPGRGTAPMVLLASAAYDTGSPELIIDLSLENGIAAFYNFRLFLDRTEANSSVNDFGNEALPMLTSQAFGKLPGVSDREAVDVVSLDLPNVAVLPGSYVVVERPSSGAGIETLVIARALEAREAARSDYGISGKGTQVTLDRPWLGPGDTFGTLRRTTVYAASERLELAEEPITDPVCGDAIELDGLYDGLESGRWLIVAGERHIPGVRGVQAAELVMIGSVRHGPPEPVEDQPPLPPGEQPHTTITLDGALGYCYVRGSMKLYANVAPATHGETRREILGAGDAARSLQEFTLRFAPLTYVPAATPSGIESTLEVYVNDVRWHEAPSLVGLSPTDHRFVTRQNDAHETTATFGTGQRGARPPTGRENIRAVYRNGIGKAGNVAAGAITLLSTRSLGVKGVLNPLAASGGADPESRDQARENVPLAVTALDRLVSVQDYEDFTRTFAGIGKAIARRLSLDGRPLVHLTIAGADDIPIAPTSDLFQRLREALVRFGDPALPVRIGLRERVVLILSAGVAIHPDYLWEKVEPEIRGRLLERFSFARRALGQDALLSEVIAVVQGVPGVEYVDVDSFGGVPELVSDRLAEGGRRISTPDEFAAAVRAIAAADRLDQRVPARDTIVIAPIPGGPPVIYAAELACFEPKAPETLILRRLAV